MSLETPKSSAAGMLEEISRFAVGGVKENMENLCSALNTVQVFQAMQKEEAESKKNSPEDETGEEGD